MAIRLLDACEWVNITQQHGQLWERNNAKMVLVQTSSILHDALVGVRPHVHSSSYKCSFKVKLLIAIE